MATMSPHVLERRKRENKVLGLLLEGCENDEIAAQLHMAKRTVKAHFNRLFLRHNIGDDGVKRICLVRVLRPGFRPNNSWARLDRKEKIIVLLLLQGMKNVRIAEQLGTTEHVIKNYLRVIYDKTGLNNRTEMAVAFLTPAEEISQ